MVVIQKKGSHRQRRIYFLVVAFEEKKVRNRESSANQSKSSFVLPLRKELLVSSSATSKERSRSSRYPSRRALRDKRASGIGSS